MSNIVISVENLSKAYRLGQIGTGTLTNDLKVWWAKKRGLPNPMLRIGQIDHGNRDGETLWALKDVSLEVEQGEVLGVIGRNGAGKSTLLKILSRVTAPTNGCVKVKGRIASLLEVGTGFHPELTGKENIYLNGAILGMTKEEVRRKFDEIVTFAEVEKFIDTPVKRFSSGMYVRLAFAVAAHLESEILLVDEVLAVGDAEFQKKCLGKMGDVASKEKRTVLFVSHNMASVNSLCQNGILLQHGQISFCGTAEATIKTYLTNMGSVNQDIKISNYRTTKKFEIIKQINVNGSAEGSVPKLDIGDDININLCLQKPYSIEQINIGIGVDNEMGERVFTVLTKNQNNTIFFSEDVINIVCHLEKVNIAPGAYYLKVAIADMYRDIDIIESYPGFEIVTSDFYGTGKLPNRKQGIIIMDAQWQKI